MHFARYPALRCRRVSAATLSRIHVQLTRVETLDRERAMSPIEPFIVSGTSRWEIFRVVE